MPAASRVGIPRDQPTRPEVPGPLHATKPGTVTCYYRGCGMPECRQAHRTLRAHYRRDTKGPSFKVDPRPAAEHLAWLLQVGGGVRGIEAASGISLWTIKQLRRDQLPGHIRQDTANAILDTTVEMVWKASADHVDVDVRAYLTRYRSLVALGYTGPWMSEQLGVPNIARILNNQRHIRADLARSIRQLADRVGDRPGPSVRARNYARGCGWMVPGMYDRYWQVPPPETDVPTETEERQERRLPIVRRLTECGYTSVEIVNELTAEGLLDPNADMKIRQRQIVRDRNRLGISSHRRQSASAA